ncbi:MAG: hypothetical protein QXH67_01595 [Candidatus Bathyarchaeia archaeon]
MMTMLSEPTRGLSQREQLKVTAQKVMTQLTLEPGTPPDWGSNLEVGEDGLKSFGLAKHSETTRDAYVLDPGKVSRLGDPPIGISPSRAAELLNLEGSYGFRLEFRPALEINLTKPSTSEFIIAASSPTGSTPVVGANVTAAMYIYEGGFTALEPTGGTTRTGIDGKCSLRFEGAETENGVIVLIVEHQGLRVVKVIPVGAQVEKAKLMADRLILDGDEELAWEALEIVPIYGNGMTNLISLNQTITRIGAAYYKLSYLEPGAEAVLAVSADGNKLFYAPRADELIYSTSEGEVPTTFSYSLERSVVIGSSIHTLRLYIWRMTW